MLQVPRILKHAIQFFSFYCILFCADGAKSGQREQVVNTRLTCHHLYQLTRSTAAYWHILHSWSNIIIRRVSRLWPPGKLKFIVPPLPVFGVRTGIIAGYCIKNINFGAIIRLYNAAAKLMIHNTWHNA